MGAGWSASTGLHVQCDKEEEYVAGDTVRAVVAMNVVKLIDLESLDLQVRLGSSSYELSALVGAEKTEHGSRVRFIGTTVFMHSRLPLIRAPGRFTPGQYQWSLVFRLPPCLPGILLESTLDNYGRAQVKYELQATARTAGAHRQELRSEACFMRVLASPPTGDPVAVERSMEFVQQGCCCFACSDPGAVAARLALDSDWALHGRDAGVTVEVDNRSGAGIEFLVLSLWKAWGVSQKPNRDPTWSSSMEFNQEEPASPERYLEGVPAHSAARGSTARRIRFKVPADLQPSHAGAAIRVQYAMRLTLQMGKCQADMHLSAPLRVFIPRRGVSGAPAAAAAAAPSTPLLAEPPPFWKPQTVHEPAAWEVADAPPLPQ